jgi:redox-sensitive bicupin YhaK (pirin superfamily)
MASQLKLNLRRASDRGHADHGWSNRWHSFSFADYYDPAHMGFRSLRVITDDRAAAGGGFPTHPHRDLEIFYYVLAGTLAHEDSMGNQRLLKPGEIQLMRAGSGPRHSEFNPSTAEPVHFLPIWITPESRGLPPAYTDWTPEPGRENAAKTLVIAAEGSDGSATIARDASIYLLEPQPGETVRHELLRGRGPWLHIAGGAVTVDGLQPTAGGAGSLEASGILEITAGGESTRANIDRKDFDIVYAGKTDDLICDEVVIELKLETKAEA